jgi:hypothetical protein
VGVTGHADSQVASGNRHDNFSQGIQSVDNLSGLIPQIHPDIQNNLVIPASRSVQLLGDLPKYLKKPVFNMHMDIFKAVVINELAPVDFPPDHSQALDQLRGIFIGDNAAPGEHPAMRNTSFDIVTIQPPVKIDRCGKRFDGSVGFFRKPAVPKFFPHEGPLLIFQEVRRMKRPETVFSTQQDRLSGLPPKSFFIIDAPCSQAFFVS